MPETSLGMLPAAGGSQMLPRTVGQGQALEALLAGGALDADKALEIGLVHRVVSRSSLEAEVEFQAVRLAGLNLDAISALKQVIADGADLPFDHGLALERRLAAGFLVNR